MEDLLSKDLRTLTSELEEIVRRLNAWNSTDARCRNLSLAITNTEDAVDKMYRTLVESVRG